MKTAKNIFSVIVFLLLAGVVFFDHRFQRSADPGWGLNFSTSRAEYLGFDWKVMYRDILTELSPERMRIVPHWSTIEPEQGKFNFSDFDYILSEAEKKDVKIILALGQKQPGWPECHHPQWYETLSGEEKEAAVLNMLAESVKHFKNFPAVAAWQVENEPFFVFGDNCGAVSKNLFEQEIDLVKSLDNRPIVVTDSGEKGSWLATTRFGGDIFGSTMYRKIYHHKREKYVAYPIPPLLYRVKAGLLRTFSKNIRDVIGVELQAEPWFATDVFQTPWETQKQLMNEKTFTANMDFARAAGFAENYLWGVEWWYYGKEKINDHELWEAAKQILNSKSEIRNKSQ